MAEPIISAKTKYFVPNRYVIRQTVQVATMCTAKGSQIKPELKRTLVKTDSEITLIEK